MGGGWAQQKEGYNHYYYLFPFAKFSKVCRGMLTHILLPSWERVSVNTGKWMAQLWDGSIDESAVRVVGTKSRPTKWPGFAVPWVSRFDPLPNHGRWFLIRLYFLCWTLRNPFHDNVTWLCQPMANRLQIDVQWPWNWIAQNRGHSSRNANGRPMELRTRRRNRVSPRPTGTGTLLERSSETFQNQQLTKQNGSSN